MKIDRNLNKWEKNIKKINLDISKDKTPYGKTTDSINYWTKNRNKFKDLYRSEKYFFF